MRTFGRGNQDQDIPDVAARAVPSVSDAEIVDHLLDLLETDRYGDVHGQPLSDGLDHQHVLASEGEFWAMALEHRPAAGYRVSLEDLCVTEWLPYSPGRYHTEDARWERRQATRQISSIADRPDGTKFVEFTPHGKASMVRGGVGSLRLAPKGSSSGLIYFLGASSSGYSYKGIPVAFDANCYDRLEPDIRTRGYSWGSVVGEIRILPSTDERIQYPRRTPRYYLLATDFERSSQIDARPTASAQIIYDVPRRGHDGKSWCFTHFKPSRHDSDLYAGIEWMEEYARRNSTTLDGELSIISDFDELHNHFTDVEFPIRDVMRHRLNIPRLRQYIGTYIDMGGLQVENYSIGDVSNSTLVIKSTVQGSFNSLPKDLDRTVTDALEQIGRHITERGDPEAAEMYQQISEELKRDQPRKSIIRSLWNGIKDAVPTVVSIVGVVEGMQQITS